MNSDLLDGISSLGGTLKLPEDRNPMRRSISSSGRLCRQYSQENRDDIQLTIKSPSFESALTSRHPRLSRSKSQPHKSFPEGIDFGDGQKGTIVAINGPITNIEKDRALFEAQKSEDSLRLTAPHNSVEESAKTSDNHLDRQIFHHKRVNSAQRRKEFASSVRRAKQIMNQEVEGSLHSSGSQCRSCNSWCSVGSFHSETHRDSLTSCQTCSARLLSSKESGFSRSMDFDSFELARSRKCSRCSMESDETGLGGMDFHSSRNSETMSLGSHRHHHHHHQRHHHHRQSTTSSRHHHRHRHRHHRHRTSSSGSHHKSSRHNSAGYSHRSSRDVSSLSVDYPDDDIFRYYSSTNSSNHNIQRSESRSSRRSTRSHHGHRDHKEKESSKSHKSHKKLSRTSSDWVDRLSPDYDMYNEHKPLEQTRSDTSNEMHFSPKPRIYKVKSLDLKPQGHYKRSGDSSPVDEPEVPAPRRPHHKHRALSPRAKSPDVHQHFVQPAEVIKRKAIQIIEAEMEKHSSSTLHVPSAAESVVLNSEEKNLPSSTNDVLNENTSVRRKTHSDKMKYKKKDKNSVSIDHDALGRHSLREQNGRRGSAPHIELTMRTPSGHFGHVSLDDDDDRSLEPNYGGTGYMSSYDTSPEVPFPLTPSHVVTSNNRHARRFHSLHSSRSTSQRSSREHSRPTSPHNKNPMRDSAYQSNEQSTEKVNSRPGSKSVSPTMSNGIMVGRSRDDSTVRYASRPSR